MPLRSRRADEVGGHTMAADRLPRTRKEVVVETSALVTLSVTVFVATYLNNLRLARRKDRLDRVSKQLSDFYGPLLALSRAADRSWVGFMDRYRPNATYFWDDPNYPTTKQHEELFRLWMRHVFMPINLRMVDVVTNKADLLDEPYVPEFFLQLCAHVASYQAILQRWDNKDFEENAPEIPFPGREIIEYVEATFGRLKAEQNDLLGIEARA
jgi:hypothetical protein